MKEFLIINIIYTNAFQPVVEMFQDMKLGKFMVEVISEENISGHIQGGNFEFRMMI